MLQHTVKNLHSIINHADKPKKKPQKTTFQDRFKKIIKNKITELCAKANIALCRIVRKVFAGNCSQKSDSSSWDSVGHLGPDSEHQKQYSSEKSAEAR